MYQVMLLLLFVAALALLAFAASGMGVFT